MSQTGAESAQHRGDDTESQAQTRARLGFIQVAFAGHNRTEDLGDPADVLSSINEAMQMLAQAGVEDARMISGHAIGADGLAIQAWQAAGFGPVEVIMPFLDGEDSIEPPPELAATATWLDGAASRASLRSPHLCQARWLVGAADLLVAVWTGRPPRGPGGTADTVHLALEHGVPVLWVLPGPSGAIRLLRPEHLFEDCGFLELLDQLASGRAPLVIDATPEALHDVMADMGLAPSARPDEVDADDGVSEVAWPWRAYSLFRRVLGGRSEPLLASPAPPDLEAQPGFKLLSAARGAAAREAQNLGAVHRSQQVILLAIAIVVATAGSATAMWPSLELPMVAVELILALVALFVWLDSARRERHLRWGAARKRAEDLRLERAAWTVGVSTVPHDPLCANSPVAAFARRRAGLPSGAFDAARVEAWGGWVIDELLSRQVAYHSDQAQVNGRISHHVHQAENLSFAVLMFLLAGFMVTTGVLALGGGHPPTWLAGLVYMAGAIVPAIGAAGLALEATLSLDVQARRSQLLTGQLKELRNTLGTQWRLEDLQSVARAAIKLQRSQEDHWSSESGRRRLYRGG
jgi:hypothetical protein